MKHTNRARISIEDFSVRRLAAVGGTAPARGAPVRMTGRVGTGRSGE